MKHLKKKSMQWIAGILALLMVFSAVPTGIFATEVEVDTTVQTLTTVDEENSIVLDKTVKLEADGTYTIELGAFATGNTETEKMESKIPLDFVFILDSSGSMASESNTVDQLRVKQLEAALETLIKKISDDAKEDDSKAEEIGYNAEHKVAITTFGYAGTGGKGSYYTRVGLNGRFGKWTNTGIFVNGEFLNYSDKNDVDDKKYTPVYELDTKNTYYVLRSSSGNATFYTATYDSNTSEWKCSNGDVVVPMTDSHDKVYTNTQFYTCEDYVYNKLTAQNYADAMVNVNNEDGTLNTNVTTAIDKIQALGATYTAYGLEMAKEILANNAVRVHTDKAGNVIKSKQVVILFTDGVSNSPEDKMYPIANAIKDTGALIYSVAVGSINNANKLILEKISSNYPDSTADSYSFTNYYANSSDMSKLEEIFTSILTDITTSTSKATLDASAIMSDYLNTGFELPENYKLKDNVQVEIQDMTYDGTNYVEVENGRTVVDYTKDDSEITVSATITDSASTSITDSISVTGFSYKDNYVAKGHPGKKLILTIKGVEATDALFNDSLIATNHSISGIGKATSIGGFEPVVTFPQPQTMMTTEAVVLDYAKPVTIAYNEWGHTSYIGVSGDLKKGLNSNFVTKYGTITKDDEKGSITYTPTTTNWDGYDSFYALGTWNSEKKSADIDTGNNLWSKVSIIPANNVYYEDTFVTETENTGDLDGDNNICRVGIEYTGNWTEITSESAGKNGEDINTDVHGGWQNTDLADDTTYSDGSAHVGTYQGSYTDEEGNTIAATTAEATFTFTGTGVDIYSRTNLTTGTVLVRLKGTTTDGEVSVSKSLIVDNLASSAGEDGYYQIPTASFGSAEGLVHGTYTVTIKVTGAAEGRYTYYLDGIRIYNPIQNQETDPIVSEAYGEEELNAVFTEVRDILISAATDESEDSLETVDGALFIDQVLDDTGIETSQIGTYVEYGPKNEVYLAKNQSIAFKVDGTSGNSYYIGLKAPEGTATKVEITNGTDKSELDIKSASDLYYKITPDANGYVVIKNMGEGLLSITKLRTTGTAVTNSGIMTASVDDLLMVSDEFSTLSLVAYEEEPETEVPSEPETEVPSEPETEAPSEPETEAPSEPETEAPSEPETEESTKPGNNGNHNKPGKVEIKNPSESKPGNNGNHNKPGNSKNEHSIKDKTDKVFGGAKKLVR